MNYFITGGTGFIGTHLSSLLHEVHPETRIYNLDIVEPGTPLPTVKNYTTCSLFGTLPVI